jgi:hypothetical protein
MTDYERLRDEALQKFDEEPIQRPRYGQVIDETLNMTSEEIHRIYERMSSVLIRDMDRNIITSLQNGTTIIYAPPHENL